MSESLLTKRLHISGLTPSITPEDLERRLSSFGRVTAMDGFGTHDALGDPRKFGFVTMEIGARELARCLNVLSGSTWKGAKLRIGEAKPDFRERLAQFNSQPLRPVRPKRTRFHGHGRPSSTLPLTPLSAAAAASTPGWIVTPSGRVVRPMRMRPERPLEPVRSEFGVSRAKGVNGKVKKRIKPPPIRARRRLVDPTKWDSVYLKGVFLDAVPVPLPISKEALGPSIPVKYDIVGEGNGEESDKDTTDSDVFSTSVQPQLIQDHTRTNLSAQQSPTAAFPTSPRIHEATVSIDVRDEANAALAILGRMFGDREDWNGRESVDEMADIEDGEARDEQIQVDEGDDMETMPCDFVGRSKSTERDKGKGREMSVENIVHFSREAEVGVEAARDGDAEMENDPPVNSEVSAQTAEPALRTNLKALFAPREDASFSLINHLDLDLDLELDTDILGISAPSGASQENSRSSQPILSIPQVVEVPATKLTAKTRSRVTLDPSLPLLFPTPDSFPHPYTPSSGPGTTTHQLGPPSCFLFPSSTRVRGLHHLPSSMTFTRSPEDTPESIREKWEKDKVLLTREWKKAWRDAKGSRKGRGAGGEIGGGY